MAGHLHLHFPADITRIFQLSGFDVIPTIEVYLIDSYRALFMPQNSSEKVLLGEVQKLAAGGEYSYSQMTYGLLYSIFTEPEKAEKTFETLSFSVRDSFAEVLTILHTLVVECNFSKLTELTKRQLVWLVNRLIILGIPNLEFFFIYLLKEIRSGDPSDINIKYTNGILDILLANKEWLFQHDRIVSLSCYVFLRVLKEHSSHPVLQDKEVKFCLSLLKEKFEACLAIGRDLVRLLQGVSRIPDFKQVWSWLLESPKSLHPEFQGLLSILKTPTNPYFLQFQLPTEMARKLEFLLNKVENEQIDFYYEFFRSEYLSTNESLVLIPDIIRYICGSIHPSNDILGSNIATRWRVIRFFFKDMTNPVAAADSKLALFFDWLFFDSTVDNIMNIEPGILLIMNSLDNQTYVSESLIEFLFFVRKDYFPDFYSEICKGVDSAMAYLLDKGVFRSIEPVFTPEINQYVQSKMHEMFQRFLPSPPNLLPPSSHPKLTHSAINPPQVENEPAMVFQPSSSQLIMSDEDEFIVPNFSPTEENELATLTAPEDSNDPNHSNHSNYRINGNNGNNSINDQNDPEFHHMDQMDDASREPDFLKVPGLLPEFGDLLINLNNSMPSWTLDDRHILDSILSIFMELNTDTDKLVCLLSKIFDTIPSYYLDFYYVPKKFLGQLIPRSNYLDSVSLGDSEPSDFSGFESASELEVPFVSIFDKVWEWFYQNEGPGIKGFHDNPRAKELVQILIKLASQNEFIGPFWLLYSLRAYSSEYPDMTEASVSDSCCYDSFSSHPFKAYAQFVDSLSTVVSRSPQDLLVSDMNVFLQLEKTVLYGILSAMFRFLPLWCVNNVQLIKLIVDGIDSIQLTHTISRIYKKMLCLLDKQGIEAVIAESFHWEPESLFNLWVFLVAEFGGDPEATELILRSFIRHYTGEGFGETSDSGGIIVKLSDLLQKVPPTLGLIQSLFVGCHKLTVSKKLGSWIVMMLSKWGQLWSSLLHFNFPQVLSRIQNSNLAAINWDEQRSDGEEGMSNDPKITFDNDVIQWLKILHCWCDPKSFPGTVSHSRGQNILLSNPLTCDLLKSLITINLDKGLSFDQFPLFFQTLEEPSTYAAEACFIGNQFQDVNVGSDVSLPDSKRKRL